MRLLRLGLPDAGPDLYDEDGAFQGSVDLYVDPATGQVYGLNREQRDALDPLWREDVPESA
jgi:hypothetical protein